MSSIIKHIKSDKVIWLVVIILAIISLISVYSSIGNLAFRKQAGNTEYYLFKHLAILISGFVLMYLTQLIPLNYFSRFSQIALVAAILLLAYTLYKGIILNIAPRWIIIHKLNLSFQSSDLAKLALIMYTARALSKKQNLTKDFKSAFINIMLPILVVCGLIVYADLSTAVILFLTCIILLFIGKLDTKYIGSILGIAIVTFAIFITILYYSPNQGRLGTWRSRLEQYFNGDSENNYQIEQSKIAIANGGILGKFPGNNTQRNLLPYSYYDFIFSMIIEQFGLIGGIFIILLYLILLYRGIRIVRKYPKKFGIFLTIGISISLIFQAISNMAVSVGLIPVTGQTLPLVSMGGTSIWVTSIAIGMILNVSKEIEKKTEENKINYAAT